MRLHAGSAPSSPSLVSRSRLPGGRPSCTSAPRDAGSNCGILMCSTPRGPSDRHRRSQPVRATRRKGAGSMALRHRGPDGPKFQMREKIMAIGDDFWIEDDDGKKVYKVNGKAARMRQTFILEDANGNELSKIQEKKLTVRDKMTIERGSTKATVHKRLIGIRDHYIVDVDGGESFKAHGNIVDHEYE